MKRKKDEHREMIRDTDRKEESKQVQRYILNKKRVI